jgi:hypothetical protein
MRTIPTKETKTRREQVLAGDSLLANIHLESGLFREQRLTCANHTDEEIVLDKIGWKNFICPKCGSDYSIGRKITVSE